MNHTQNGNSQHSACTTLGESLRKGYVTFTSRLFHIRTPSSQEAGRRNIDFRIRIRAPYYLRDVRETEPSRCRWRFPM